MSRTLRILVCSAIMGLLVLLPGTGDTASRTVTGDLDGDGDAERYLLTGHRLTVREGEAMLWQSPPEWRVDGFSLGDVENDGAADLVMSLWKKGSFGPVRPFWEDREDRSYKNHLFVYRLTGDALRPVWCSSDLDRPIVSFVIRDADSNGLNELVVEEGEYRRTFGERYALDRKAPARTTVWRWDGWGFSLCMDIE